MKILLTGTNGQVGHALIPYLRSLGELIALDRKQMDLSDPDKIRTVVRQSRPDLIINPAAYTAVDRAEAETALCMAINVAAPTIIAEEAKKIGAALIHFSTDYVFDGRLDRPYHEGDAPNPQSVYGRSKYLGEQGIIESGVAHWIIRTSWVYGAYGNNFLKTMLRLAAERTHMRIVADQFGAPTWASRIASVLRDMLCA